MRTEVAGVKRGKIIIYTGAPPVRQQIANQVRSASGMTFGISTADGPRLAPLAYRRMITPIERQPAPLVAPPGDAPLTDRLLYRLQVLVRDGLPLPSRKKLTEEFGPGFKPALQTLLNAGRLANVFWGSRANPNQLAIWLPGRASALRCAGFDANPEV